MCLILHPWTKIWVYARHIVVEPWPLARPSASRNPAEPQRWPHRLHPPHLWFHKYRPVSIGKYHSWLLFRIYAMFCTTEGYSFFIVRNRLPCWLASRDSRIATSRRVSAILWTTLLCEVYKCPEAWFSHQVWQKNSRVGSTTRKTRWIAYDYDCIKVLATEWHPLTHWVWDVLGMLDIS